MRRITIFMVALMGWAGLATLWSGAALAQIYTCRDAKGQLITSDRPMPECADRAIREFGRGGTVVREIPAPLTPEEKAKKAVEDERAKKREAELAEQRRRDRLLLSRYESVDALEAARQRNLRLAEEAGKSANDRHALLEKEKATNLAEVESLKKAGKRVPVPLTRKLESIDVSLGVEKKRIEEHHAEIKRINERYDGERVRYLELMAASKTGR